MQLRRAKKRSKKPSFRQKHNSQYRQNKKAFPVLSPFPCGIKKATALLEQWVKDSVIFLSHVDRLPSQEDQRDAKFCLYHLRKGHSREYCVVFRRIFNKNVKAREVLLPNKVALNAHERPSLKHHNNKGKGQVLIVSTLGRDEDLSMQPEVSQTLIR